MESVDNATPVQHFLIRLTTAEGSQFEVEHVTGLIAEINPGLKLGVSAGNFTILFSPAGPESLHGTYSWLRLVTAWLRGAFRIED